MKTIVWLAVLMLCPTLLVVAEKSPSTSQSRGAVCNSACVTKVNNVATCDPDCTDRSGQCVHVDDAGVLTNVADSEACKGRTHIPDKPVRASKETEKQREEDLRIEELYKQAP